MNRNIFQLSPLPQFEIHQINSTGKSRDSPTSSILKTPTPIFVTSRSSSAKTKRLTFANGPIDLQTLKNETNESNVSFDSYANGEKKINNGEISIEENIIELAVSPNKTMQVSPESWKAFLEYKKRYNDYANETEKTDYTYSRLSKYCHKEIIPGFLIRPNLSRLSISSKKSSFFSPNSQTSFKESSQSKNYEFEIFNHSDSKIFNHSDSEIFSDTNQSKKFGRSKYYLRSSSYDSKEPSKADITAGNYLETEYYGQPFEKKMTKAYAYTTAKVPTPTAHHYGKVRQLELDDADIDEVDDQLNISPVYSENHYFTSNDSNASQRLTAAVRPQVTSHYFKNFFSTIFLFITSVGTITRNLFLKYILRKHDNGYRSQFTTHNWNGEKYVSYAANDSWIPWKEKLFYSAPNYYTDRNYGRPLNLPQKVYYYFYDRFSQLKNLIWGNTSMPAFYGNEVFFRKAKFWWFFIPLLLLAGSFLGYIDFFSDPKAVLKTMYNSFLFIPSFLHYTFIEFIPWLILEAIPYLALQAIPKLITVTLPYFFMYAIPYYFWVIIHFLANLTFTSIWKMLVGALTIALNFLYFAEESVFNNILSVISSGYYLSSEYLLLFYSNFCMLAFYFFTILTDFALNLF